MNIATINYDHLNKLCDHIRRQRKIPIKIRRAIVEDLLKAADVVNRCDIENLMCIPCAAKLAGYTLAGFRRKAERDLHIYRLCHRQRLSRFVDHKSAMIEYVDRREVLAIKKPSDKLQLDDVPLHKEGNTPR